jgi:DNA-binding transcriptional regulator YiaG
MDKPTPTLSLADCLSRLKMSKRKFAARLGVSAQAVSSWGETIPEGRVYQVLYLWPRLATPARARPKKRGK